MSKATAMTRRTRKMSKTLGKSHRAAFRGGSIVDSKSTINPLDGTKLTLLRRVLIVALLVSSGCVFVPRAMWNRAEENRQRIGQVKIGQTLDEVRAIMRKDPEKRELRSRFDGKSVEFWTFVTHYGLKLQSTITFIDGHVEEIRATTWEEKD